MAGTEKWLIVSGAPDYEVSDRGRVRRIVAFGRYPVGGIVRGGLRNGYPSVVLKTNEGKKSLYIHRLVLMAFGPDQPSPSHECAHIDGNRANPAIENLRWASRAENLNDRLRHGTHARGENCATSRLMWSDIDVIRRASGTQRDIAARFGIHQSHVSRIKTGSRNCWKEVPPCQ